jgi:hypothetical protein
MTERRIEVVAKGDSNRPARLGSDRNDRDTFMQAAREATNA